MKISPQQRRAIEDVIPGIFHPASHKKYDRFVEKIIAKAKSDLGLTSKTARDLKDKQITKLVSLIDSRLQRAFEERWEELMLTISDGKMGYDGEENEESA